jgi:hypothetical protein
MNEIYRTIDWVEYPAQPISPISVTALFTEEAKARCVFAKKVANELFHGNINI